MSETEPEFWPVEKSRSGTNAFYHFCPIRGAQQNYGLCMHILHAIDEGRVGNDSFVDCQRACTRRDCDALKMRDEEIKAGHALYYKPRTNINPVNSRPEKEAQESALIVSSGKYDLNNPSYARGWHSVGSGTKSGPSSRGEDAQANGSKTAPRRAPPKPTPTPPKPKSGFIEAGMADLVNAIASEEKAKPVEPPKPAVTSTTPSPLKPMPGESPLEFARRRAQALKGAN